MDELFPPGPGRDLVLQNCTNCHSIVPIVLARFDSGGWDQNRAKMEPKVPQVSKQQVDQVYAYLKKNFYPGKPVPKLPQDLLNTWTSY